MIKTIHAESLSPLCRVGIVVSRFNSEITEKLAEGAIERLSELGFSSALITLIWVAGAVEIPLTAKRLAQTGQVDVIIALGAVIQGETAHMQYVCDQVSQGCQHVMLTQDIPIVFGVLTTDNEKQALDRIGGHHGHKGRDAADVAYEMVSILRQIDSLSS